MIQPEEQTDIILAEAYQAKESKRMLNPELWAGIALRLEWNQGYEHEILEDLRQEVAKLKLQILQKQEKKNVSLADAEVEANDLNKKFRLQGHKVTRIDEFVMLAKNNSKLAGGY